MTVVTDRERAVIRQAIELTLMDSGSSRFNINGTVKPIEKAGEVVDKLLATIVSVVERIQDGGPPDHQHTGVTVDDDGVVTVSTGHRPLDLIAADVLCERLRQVYVEGYTAEQDRYHEPGALAAAGATYLMPPDKRIMMGGSPIQWPFEEGRYKPADRDRDIVRGLALGLAELERLRAEGT